jgi:hypothetical protein
MPSSDYKIAVYNNSASNFIAIDVTPSQTPNSSGWTRVTYTFTTPVGCTSVRWYPFRNGSAIPLSTVYLWGAQLEQSTTVGEYIPTTSTINSAPRFDHNPTTGESLGLLVEEQRTNLMLRSEEFAAWTKGGSTISANAIADPAGLLTADKIAEDSSNSSHRVISTAPTWAGSTAYTFSFFAKAGERSLVYGLLGTTVVTSRLLVRFDLATGVATTSSGSPTAIAAVHFGNGWYRCSITFTSIASPTGGVVLGIWNETEVYAGSDGSGLHIWGAQLEAGSFPTSYIPTTTATATRAADVASISGSNFSSWYNTTQGTVFTSQRTLATDSQQGAYWFSASSVLGRGIAATIDARDVTQRLSLFIRDDVSAGQFRVDPLVDDQQQNIAHSWSGGTHSASLNSLLSAGSYNTIYPGISQLRIGFNEMVIGSPVYLSGTIRRLTYWPARLPNETLQTITQ